MSCHQIQPRIKVECLPIVIVIMIVADRQEWTGRQMQTQTGRRDSKRRGVGELKKGVIFSNLEGWRGQGVWGFPVLVWCRGGGDRRTHHPRHGPFLLCCPHLSGSPQTALLSQPSLVNLPDTLSILSTRSLREGGCIMHVCSWRVSERKSRAELLTPAVHPPGSGGRSSTAP